jgi:hypothetical protein
MTQTGTGPKVASWLIFTTWVGASAAANYAHGDNVAASLLMASAPVGFAATTGILEMLVSKGVKIGWSAIVAMVMVATVAGVASYIGLVGLATESGITGVAPWLLPIGFDGVVLAASLAIRSLGQTVATAVDVDSVLAKHEVTEWPVATRVDNEAAAKPVAMDALDEALATWTREAEDDLAMATPAPVAKPEPVATVRPTPRRNESLASQLAEPWNEAQAMEYWLAGMTSGAWKVAELDELIGRHYGVSGRTFRRRREVVGLRPASAQPSS